MQDRKVLTDLRSNSTSDTTDNSDLDHCCRDFLLGSFYFMRRIFNIFFFILTVTLMVMIFFFSSQNGEESEGMSNQVVVFFLKIFIPGFDSLSPERQNSLIGKYSYIVRKGAHFSEYMMLAFSFTSFLSTKRNVMIYPKRGVSAFLFSALYSISDEMHQYFSDGRSPALRDVLIDSTGALVGVIISLLLFFLIERVKKTPPPDIQHEGLC